jgi:hypothetical protein
MRSITRFALALTVAAVALLSPTAHAQIEGTWWSQKPSGPMTLERVGDNNLWDGTMTMSYQGTWNGKAVEPVFVQVNIENAYYTRDGDYFMHYNWEAWTTYVEDGTSVRVFDHGVARLSLKNSNRLEGWWQSRQWTDWGGSRWIWDYWTLDRI